MLQDYQEIISCVQKYVDGELNADRTTMSQAFTEDATIHGVFGTDVWGGSIELLYDAVEGGQPNPEMQTRIDVLDVYETIAVVRIIMEGGEGPDYVDYHSLIKGPEGWKVVAKVFHSIMPE